MCNYFNLSTIPLLHIIRADRDFEGDNIPSPEEIYEGRLTGDKNMTNKFGITFYIPYLPECDSVVAESNLLLNCRVATYTQNGSIFLEYVSPDKMNHC